VRLCDDHVHVPHHLRFLAITRSPTGPRILLSQSITTHRALRLSTSPGALPLTGLLWLYEQPCETNSQLSPQRCSCTTSISALPLIPFPFLELVPLATLVFVICCSCLLVSALALLPSPFLLRSFLSQSESETFPFSEVDVVLERPVSEDFGPNSFFLPLPPQFLPPSRPPVLPLHHRGPLVW
jgi:hypothetical protein